MKSGVIACGVQRYIRKALEDYHMFYHFLDGISRILLDPELTCMIPIRDRNLVRCLFGLWKSGVLNENNWDIHCEMQRRSA
jgi:hypothetical protein